MPPDLPHALRFPGGEVPGRVSEARELLAHPGVRGLALVVAMEDGSLHKLTVWEPGAGFQVLAGLELVKDEAVGRYR